MASAINLTVHLEYGEVVERLKADDWFCADGERKGGEGTSDGETDNKRH